MKIGFVTNGVITQHATMKRAVRLAPALIEAGHDVTVIIEAAEQNRSATRKIAGLRTVEFPPQLSFQARAVKERLAAAQRFDVIHICGLGWRNALRPSRLAAKLAVMDHVEIESALPDSPRFRRLLQARLERWSLRMYSAHVGGSSYLEAWLRHHLFQKGPSKPVLRLSFANDFHGQSADPEAIAALRSIYGARKVVLYFGNFYRNYGFWEILRSAQSIARVRDDFIVALAGRGPEEAAGREFVAREGLDRCIRFCGYLGDDAALAHFATAHACVVPLFDTEVDWARSPGKLFNSMQSRRPIVTAAIGEARDCFSDARYFYRADRPASMVESIITALDTPDDWLINYSPAEHSWDKRARVWLAWISALIKSG